jgi:hypothetical protein
MLQMKKKVEANSLSHCRETIFFVSHSKATGEK